jgi:hypothetical protein
MRMYKRVIGPAVLAFVWLSAADAGAQPAASESRWAVDVAVGIDPSINGVVNSGAIGRLQDQAVAILPQPYGQIYGTGVQLRFGGGYMLDEFSELRGVFIYQSADADLVRLGDYGPSSLYAQYSDYKSLALDFGYRRYIPLNNPNWRPFGEVTLGAAFVDEIDAQLAAPELNVVFDGTDFYDPTAAFTWSIGGGVLFRASEKVDLSAQIGLRHVGGLSEVDQFIGTGLDDVNNDTARLTFPIVVGVRFRF